MFILLATKRKIVQQRIVFIPVIDFLSLFMVAFFSPRQHFIKYRRESIFSLE